MRKRMLDYSQEELQRLGADITTREIYQQPEVWQEAFDRYKDQAADIAAFLKKSRTNMTTSRSFLPEPAHQPMSEIP